MLTGRALAIAAALDWPGAAEQAAAVLDDVLKRTPSRADAALSRAPACCCWRASNDKALSLAEAATAIPGVSPRVHYVVGRALLAAGKPQPGSRRSSVTWRTTRSTRAPSSWSQPAARAGAAAAARAPTAGELRSRARPSAADAQRLVRLQHRLAAGVAGRGAPGGARRPGVIVELRPGARTATTARPNARACRCWCTAAAAARRRRWRARARATCSPTPSSSRCPRCCPAASASSSARRRAKIQRQGEVTTLERDGALYFLVLNASTATLPEAEGRIRDVREEPRGEKKEPLGRNKGSVDSAHRRVQLRRVSERSSW